MILRMTAITAALLTLAACSDPVELVEPTDITVQDYVAGKFGNVSTVPAGNANINVRAFAVECHRYSPVLVNGNRYCLRH